MALSLIVLSACTGRLSPRPTPSPAFSPTTTAAPTATHPATARPPTASRLPPPTESTAAPTAPGQATASPRPSDTPTPFPITLELSPTATPEPFPFAEIQILSPGPLSRVSTPIRLSAILVPGAGGRARVELLGEDGRLLTRYISQHTANPNQRVNLSADLDFEIESVAETGTLSVSVDDSFGRTTHLTSVEVILLSAGPSDLNPEGDLLAPVVVLDPQPGGLVEGGELTVTGLARPTTALPLAIELINREGNVVGSRQAEVEDGPPGEHRSFTATIPYSVSDPTQVLLVVRERSDRFVGNIHIFSQEIVISP